MNWRAIAPAALDVDEAYDEMHAASMRHSFGASRNLHPARRRPAERFRDALVRACERGVRVRVLLDAFGSEEVREEFITPLRERVRAWRGQSAALPAADLPQPSQAAGGRRRSCGSGGFNIGPEYEGDGINRGWCDSGLVIRGPWRWNLRAVSTSCSPWRPSRRGGCAASATGCVAMRQQCASHRGQRPVVLFVRGPMHPRRLLRRAMHPDLRAARDVAIASAYFLPISDIRRMLYRVMRAGGRVRILLAGKTDVPLARYAAERFYRRLFRRGIDIHEYQPHILHAKLVIIDDVVYTGSSNLDRRSLEINHELLLRL